MIRLTIAILTIAYGPKNSILRRTNTACKVPVGLPDGAQQC